VHSCAYRQDDPEDEIRGTASVLGLSPSEPLFECHPRWLWRIERDELYEGFEGEENRDEARAGLVGP
jgi:hypothetical protein